MRLDRVDDQRAGSPRPAARAGRAVSARRSAGPEIESSSMGSGASERTLGRPPPRRPRDPHGTRPLGSRRPRGAVGRQRGRRVTRLAAMPGLSSDLDRVVDVVAFQAAACAQSSSPLYGRILDAVVADLRRGRRVRRAAHGPGRRSPRLRPRPAVPRRGAPDRARGSRPRAGGLLPVGGRRRTTAIPGPPSCHGRRATATRCRAASTTACRPTRWGARPCSSAGYAEVARQTGLPLRVLEVGASAGPQPALGPLRLRHRPGGGGRPGQPGALRAASGRASRRSCRPTFEVAERRGCDRNPLDATTAEGRRTLMSYVWPDQTERLARLEAAIEVARRVPAAVEQADAAGLGRPRAWPSPRPGVATVVVHSIVLQYLSHRGAASGSGTRWPSAGARATDAAPLAWLRMEPGGDRAEVRLTTWPGGDERCSPPPGYHGQPGVVGAPRAERRTVGQAAPGRRRRVG